MIWRAGNRCLTDIGMAIAGDPPVIGNLEFSRSSINASFTDHAASMWRQINGTTESHWNTTINLDIHESCAPHINAPFPGLSANLQRWMISKFGSQH
jgi:hypothetical protein